MKQKISKSLLMPMLYGIFGAWILVGGLGVALMSKYGHHGVFQMVFAISLLLLMGLIPALFRGAWVYSNLRRFHNGEYFYKLGNGAELRKALAGYERRVLRSVVAWIHRSMLCPGLNVMAVAYLLMVLKTGDWASSLWVVGAMALVALAVLVGVAIMLFAARKMSYDKYGNLKNN